MKSKRWILLIVVLVIGLGFGGFYIYYGKQDCEEFIEECYSRVVGRAGGMAVLYDDVRRRCPNNCIRYQEWNGYFKDKDKKKAYWSKKVKKCEEKVEQCLKKYDQNPFFAKFECPRCDEFGNEIYLLN